jgi:hypothetical protein
MKARGKRRNSWQEIEEKWSEKKSLPSVQLLFWLTAQGWLLRRRWSTWEENHYQIGTNEEIQINYAGMAAHRLTLNQPCINCTESKRPVCAQTHTEAIQLLLKMYSRRRSSPYHCPVHTKCETMTWRCVEHLTVMTPSRLLREQSSRGLWYIDASWVVL